MPGFRARFEEQFEDFTGNGKDSEDSDAVRGFADNSAPRCDARLSEHGKQVAVRYARALLLKSCTLLEKLGDLDAGYLSLQRSFQLPTEVRERIRCFLPTPEEELEGRQMLGLHNGHDYVFHSISPLPAGRLKCSYDSCESKKGRVGSVADFCASLGCPVAPAAPVALALRCSDRERLQEHRGLVPLPAEFAVLVPNDAGASTASLRNLQAMLEPLEQEDVYVADEADEAFQCGREGWEDWDFPVTRPRGKRRRRSRACKSGEQPDPQDPPLDQRPLLLDRQLHSAAGYAHPDHVLGRGPGPVRQHACRDQAPKVLIRDLLGRGANPSIPVGGETACEKAVQARNRLQAHIQDLRDSRLCHEQVLQRYALSETFEEAREHARSFLAELQMLEESVALLRAAAQVWRQAAPAKRTVCSRQCLFGKGVVRADPCALREALMVAQQESGHKTILVEDIRALAAAMWKLAQARQKEGSGSGCGQAELEFEAPDTEGLIAERSMYRCSQCGMRPAEAFNSSQLTNSRKGKRRCKSCLKADLAAPTLNLDLFFRM